MIDLNSRDIALLAWLALFLLALLGFKATRGSAVQLVKAFFHPKIAGAVAVAIVYIVGCLWLLHAVGIFAPRNLKTAIFWFVGTGFAAMMSLTTAAGRDASLGGVARGAFAVTAFITFLSGINTLPLWAELVLLPVLLFATLMAAIAAQKPEHAVVARLFTNLLAVTGLSLLAFSLYRIFFDWAKFEALHQARELAVPIALTFLFLPFLFLFVLIIAHESAAARLRYRIADPRLRRYVRWRGVLAFGLSRDMFGRYVTAVTRVDLSDRGEVRRIIAEIRRIRRRERNPPPVDWKEGWSPYDAMKFLSSHGLGAGPYRRSGDIWGTDAQVGLGAALPISRLHYRLSGTEHAVTRLEVELTTRNSDPEADADARFFEVAYALVEAALGDETAARFARSIADGGSAQIEAGAFTVAATRDDWRAGSSAGYSRRCVMRHPAHRDPGEPSPLVATPTKPFLST